MSDNPWAPPPGGPAGGQWPAPPRSSPWSRAAASVGVPLGLATFLTVATGWAVIRATFVMATRSIVDDVVFDEYGAVSFSKPSPWLPVLAFALAALVAWVVFAVALRARRPEPGTLLPYGIVGGLAGALSALFLVARVSDWLTAPPY